MRWRRARAAVWWEVLEAKTCERSCASERGGGSVAGVVAVVVVEVEGGVEGAEDTGCEARRERSCVVRRVFWRSREASWVCRAGRSTGGAGMAGECCWVLGGDWSRGLNRREGARARVRDVYRAALCFDWGWLGLQTQGFRARRSYIGGLNTIT